MDRPVPEGVTTHQIEFSLMGVLAPLPSSYTSGDLVCYGGMIYRPEGGSGLMVHITGDHGKSGEACWLGESGVTKHYAQIIGNIERGFHFYCS